MKMLTIQTGLLGVNSYFLVNEQTNDCVLIDGGENYNRITEFAKEQGIKIVALLLTHSHFDHSLNAKQIQDDGVKVYASKLESLKLQNGDVLNEHLKKRFRCFKPDYEFVDGETLRIADIDVKVMITPGHTDGSAVFIVDDMIFSGDTLFYESVGRTDFPTGNTAELIKSVKKLYALGDDYKVYPGHGEPTSIFHEKKYNPYIRND